jgi:glyoxylase-like metal-dependent hydrolase (beta-lactamase superfamily II)
MQPRTNPVRLFGPLLAGPPWPVGRPLRDGDEVAGFQVVHAPGHTPGHILFYRPSDRLVVAGDLLANINWLTRREGLHEPPPVFSVDARQNRQSLRLLLSLKPSLVCFGHGPPLRDLSRLEQKQWFS